MVLSFLGEYGAEPMIINDKTVFLNTDRDIENARDFFKTGDDGLARSLDPRLIDPVRNIHMGLDRPPLQPRNVQPLQHIYDDCKSDIRPKVYKDGYESIYPGDIQYYVDAQQAEAYSAPNYVNQQVLMPYLYQDPMGSLQPMYDRVPLYENGNQLSDYSHDRDAMSFREDMMAHQSRLYNRTDYQLYVGHFRQK